MKTLVVLIVLLCSACARAQPNAPAKRQEIRKQRAALEQKFEELCDQEFDYFRRGPNQTLLFLKGQQFDSVGNEKHAEYAKLLGTKLLALAKRAITQGNPTLAYDLLHEAHFFHNETAGRVIGQEIRAPRSTLASSTHSHLRWKRKTYFLIATEHFQVATKDEAEGVALANQLEQLHTIWSQLFFVHWSDGQRLKKSIEQGSSLLPRAKTRLHKVVLFPSRDAYVGFLAPRQPRVEITLGFYDVAGRMSYFFAGKDASESTQLHEVTHQLFQEITKTSRRETFANNFWAIEGVAMYMESLFVAEPVAVVGGLWANRLQYARFRRLQEQFYVPVTELMALSRNQLQRDKRIRKIYSQAAGLTHYLMDAKAGSMREDYVEFLRQVYVGKAEASTLSAKISNLDRDYAEYLRVEASDFENTWIPNTLKSLCLGAMKVDDKMLSRLGKQTKLEWLDLAGTPVTDKGLKCLQETRSLRQLTLDGVPITNASVEWVSLNRELEELDLSNTLVTNAAVRELVKLKKLETLWLSNVDISDEILVALQRMESLKFVALDGTRVTVEAKERLRNAKPDLTIQ